MQRQIIDHGRSCAPRLDFQDLSMDWRWDHASSFDEFVISAEPCCHCTDLRMDERTDIPRQALSVRLDACGPGRRCIEICRERGTEVRARADCWRTGQNSEAARRSRRARYKLRIANERVCVEPQSGPPVREVGDHTKPAKPAGAGQIIIVAVECECRCRDTSLDVDCIMDAASDDVVLTNVSGCESAA
jgi:hypothetical protein